MGNASFVFIRLSVNYKSLFSPPTRDFVEIISNLFRIRLLTILKRLLLIFRRSIMCVNIS